MSESKDEGEYLHVFGEMDVGEEGFEDGGQLLELEANVVFKLVLENVDLALVEVAFGVIEGG